MVWSNLGVIWRDLDHHSCKWGRDWTEKGENADF